MYSTARLGLDLLKWRASSGPFIFGHDDIGDQKINAPGICDRQFKRFFSVGCRQHEVPALSKNILHKHPHGTLIFDQQDRPLVLAGYCST